MQAFQMQTFRFIIQYKSVEPLVTIHRLTRPFGRNGLIPRRLLNALLVVLLGRLNKEIQVGDTLHWLLPLID